MKKRKLRNWVKLVILALGVYTGICLANYISRKIEAQKELETQAISYCVSQGRSEQKCIEGLYGN